LKTDQKYQLRIKLEYDNEGNPTMDSMKLMMKELVQYRRKVIGSGDNIEAAYIKVNSAGTEAIKQYSENRYNRYRSYLELKKSKDVEGMNKLNIPNYKTGVNDCIGFVNNQMHAAGSASLSGRFPKLAIKNLQGNKGYYYKYKEDKLESFSRIFGIKFNSEEK